MSRKLVGTVATVSIDWIGVAKISPLVVPKEDLEVREITRHNGRELAASFETQTTIAFNALTSTGIDAGESMSEHETRPSDSDVESPADQAARYRSKLTEIAELVARIRHEINNPLTGVLGQAQLLLREDLSERARKRAQTIEELAIRMRDIVAQLREIQKPAEHENDSSVKGNSISS